MHATALRISDLARRFAFENSVRSAELVINAAAVAVQMDDGEADACRRTEPPKLTMKADADTESVRVQSSV